MKFMMCSLDHGIFKSDRDFAKAVRRVFYNAFIYNPDTEPVPQHLILVVVNFDSCGFSIFVIFKKN